MTVSTRQLDAISGKVIWPDSPEYDKARTVMRGDVDKRPAVIVQVEGSDAIRRVIDLARETGLELAVRSGGHSSAGHSATEGGIVLDVRRLKSLEFAADDSTVWAGAGLTAAEVTQAAWDRRRLIGFGDTGSVGIAGLTLGGGVGYAVRKYGLTIDNLLAVEIVTADGQLLMADEANHPDLFWALRGGGGNFGVATRFRYRLQPVDTFVGGMLILPATAETIAGFIAAAESAPEELSTIANVMNCPPFPMVPEEVVGKTVIFGLLAYFGDAEAGQRALAPFRALGQPYADLLAESPYPSIYGPEDDSYRPKAIDHVFFMDHVGASEAQAMLDAIESSDSALRAVQLRVLGGAMARVPVDATAFAHRQARIMAIVVNFYEGDDDFTIRAAWTRDLSARLEQGVPGAYVNFIREDNDAAVRSAYPGPHYDALAHIKKRYDPGNLFRLNQNVPPAIG